MQGPKTGRGTTRCAPYSTFNLIACLVLTRNECWPLTLLNQEVVVALQLKDRITAWSKCKAKLGKWSFFPFGHQTDSKSLQLQTFFQTEFGKVKMKIMIQCLSVYTHSVPSGVFLFFSPPWTLREYNCQNRTYFCLTSLDWPPQVLLCNKKVMKKQRKRTLQTSQSHMEFKHRILANFLVD